jgi:pimeloyl-ACP methyl ester carboxylesterase
MKREAIVQTRSVLSPVSASVCSRYVIAQPPDYSKISRPILLVTGEQDSLRGPGFGMKLQAEIRGTALHVVRNAGHCPHIDAPAEFNAAAMRFLQPD